MVLGKDQFVMFLKCPVGGGVLPEKLGGGVWPVSQNPYPIYDRNLRFSLVPCLWPEEVVSSKTHIQFKVIPLK